MKQHVYTTDEHVRGPCTICGNGKKHPLHIRVDIEHQDDDMQMEFGFVKKEAPNDQGVR
jgi:hypothetical protein